MTRVALAVAGIALVAFPLWAPGPYYVNVGSQILLYAIFALGINVLVGYAGLVSLGHAGLFGTAAGVGTCARWWLTQIDRQPWATFVTRGAVPGSSRALGWDTMLLASSCGTRMSERAFGHTGFTGTSLWVDPDRDRYVVLLSNRVHPTRAGEGMTAARAAAHDAIADDLDGAGR